MEEENLRAAMANLRGVAKGGETKAEIGMKLNNVDTKIQEMLFVG